MKETQRQQIIRYIKDNDGITSMQAYTLGITQLATRISELKERGYEFSTPWSKAENGKRFVTYHIEKEPSHEEKSPY